MSSEQDLQRTALHWLNLQPDIFAWRNQSVGVYDANKKVFRKKGAFEISGTSDVLGVFSDGRIIAIEVKKPGSKESSLSDAQKAFLAKIKKMNGICGWIQSIEDLETIINDARMGRD